MTIALSARERVEARLRQLEGGPALKSSSSAKKNKLSTEKYDYTRSPANPNVLR